MQWDCSKTANVKGVPKTPKTRPADMGPGNIVTIEIKSEYISEVFTGFGERGIRAETVADKAAKAALRYLAAGVPVSIISLISYCPGRRRIL